MSIEEPIPDGYEVKRDMFGLPYLERKPSPRVQRWAERLFVPSLVALVLVIWLIFR